MTGRVARLEIARSRAPHGQKPRSHTPAYLLFVNRPAGAVVARHAFALRMTPNQVTATGVLLAAAALAALLAAALWPWASVAGSVLLLLAYVFDSADGQLARLSGGGSAAGEWLDHVVDIGKTTAIHGVVAALIVVQRPAPPLGWIAAPLVFVVVSTTSFFSLTLRDQLLARQVPGPPAVPFRLVRAFTGLPNDHAALCVVVAFAAWPSAFLPLYTALAAVSALLLGRSLRHSYAVLAVPPAEAAPHAASPDERPTCLRTT